MTAPANLATVSSTVTVSASSSAVSPATIASVQFYLDGSPLGSSTPRPASSRRRGSPHSSPPEPARRPATSGGPSAPPQRSVGTHAQAAQSPPNPVATSDHDHFTCPSTGEAGCWRSWTPTPFRAPPGWPNYGLQ